MADIEPPHVTADRLMFLDNADKLDR